MLDRNLQYSPSTSLEHSNQPNTIRGIYDRDSQSRPGRGIFCVPDGVGRNPYAGGRGVRSQEQFFGTRANDPGYEGELRHAFLEDQEPVRSVQRDESHDVDIEPMPAMAAGTLETIVLAAIIGCGLSFGAYLVIRQIVLLVMEVTR